MTEPSRNPRGRPPLTRGEPSMPVHVRLTTHTYSAAVVRAQHERTSLATLVRRAVDRYLRQP